MEWLNEPPEWMVKGDRIRITSAPQSDFWRKTHYGFIRDSGHFYYDRVAGDFIAEVKVGGRYSALYDQAGLMLRVDEANWIKCGIEFVDGVQQASVVVTRDFSDWSVAPLAENPAQIWLRARRKAEAVEIHFSLDGSRYTMLRTAYLVPAESTLVGPMCASPDGNGFDALFEGFAVNRY